MNQGLIKTTNLLAGFIRNNFREERPLSMRSIGTVGFEEKDGKIIHVFPVSDGENIYKISVEKI